MKHAVLLVALLCLAPVSGHASEQFISQGHIDAGGPWTRFSYSVAVVKDSDGPDGFFFDVTPYRGKKIKAVITRNGACVADVRCAGADLDLNFHDTTQAGFPNWVYAGGCSTATANETCLVPESASRGEVSAYSGADLDVSVYLL